MSDEAKWAPQLCTASIACPVCLVPAGECCLSDRPLHLERWDAWAASGFAERARARKPTRAR